jgi:hypothetical protein
MLKWTYDSPTLKIGPKSAFAISKLIREDFTKMRSEGLNETECVKKLKENETVLNFSKSFPVMFKLCTSDSTTNENMNAVLRLAELREKVNSGELSEMRGEYEALHVAATQIESRVTS